MEEERSGTKHPCPDCRFCQWCGDDRCSLCRGECRPVRKLSLSEQIALYEAINGGAEPKSGTQGGGAAQS